MLIARAWAQIRKKKNEISVASAFYRHNASRYVHILIYYLLFIFFYLRLYITIRMNKKLWISYLFLITSICRGVLTGAQPNIFQGRAAFVELGHFDKHFIKKSRKKAPGKISEFFLLDTLKTILFFIYKWNLMGAYIRNFKMFEIQSNLK